MLSGCYSLGGLCVRLGPKALGAQSTYVAGFPGRGSSTFGARGSWLLPSPEMGSGAFSQGVLPACLSPRLGAS